MPEISTVRDGSGGRRRRSSASVAPAAACAAALFLQACAAPYSAEINQLAARAPQHPTMSCSEIYRDLGRTRFYLREIADIADIEAQGVEQGEQFDQVMLALSPTAEARAGQQQIVAVADQWAQAYDQELREAVDRLAQNAASLIDARNRKGCP